MGYVNVSEEFSLDTSVIGLSDKAFRAYVATICYSSRWSLRKMHLSYARMFVGQKARQYIQELADAGLVEWVDDRSFVILGEGELWSLRKPARRHIPASVRQEVYERDGFRCVECSATERLSLDHIHPYSLGGTDDLDNLQTLCKPCNSRKGARV